MPRFTVERYLTPGDKATPHTVGPWGALDTLDVRAPAFTRCRNDKDTNFCGKGGAAGVRGDLHGNRALPEKPAWRTCMEDRGPAWKS